MDLPAKHVRAICGLRVRLRGRLVKKKALRARRASP
jgi:hypothetical protein